MGIFGPLPPVSLPKIGLPSPIRYTDQMLMWLYRASVLVEYSSQSKWCWLRDLGDVVAWTHILSASDVRQRD